MTGETLDIQDFVPTGGGSLREPYGTREPVATFTDTRFIHPDEIWHPLGGELDSRVPSLSAGGQGETQQRDAEQSDGTGDAFDLHATSRTIRSVLRPRF